MFDLAWSEIALIILVAVVVIGPKDLPVAIKGLAGFIRKARQMAGEFQVHVDDMMRETKLDEVKKQIDEVRTGMYDMRRQVQDAVDMPDVKSDLKSAFSDPFAAAPAAATSGMTAPVAEAPVPAATSAEPAVEAEPPAFVPPGTQRRDTV